MNECDGKVLARGLCSKHYARWRANGTTEKVRRSGSSPCSVDGCKKPVQGQGLCSAHYARFRRNGSPTKPGRNRAEIRECARDGCPNEVVWHRSTQRKYCSTECYQATPRPEYDYGLRVCKHCTSEYTPTGPMQKYCVSCIGPTVFSKGGHSRSLGLKRLLEYGVTHTEWLEMVARHGGLCWICLEKPAAVLDHCHSTGKPRGALCQGCNSQLGGVERHGWLERALEYLKETSAVTS